MSELEGAGNPFFSKKGEKIRADILNVANYLISSQNPFGTDNFM